MITFDVVIPTKNRNQDLDRIIKSIDLQTVRPSNVIIIDQSDKCENIYKSDIYKIIHIHNSNISGLTEAKNIGVSLCQSDVIHFFDDDIILDSNYFEIINNHFETHEEFYGICGRQKNSISSPLKLFFFDLFHIGEFKDIRKKCNSGKIKNDLVPTNILPGGITAYRRKVFEKYRFDENLIRYCLGEDMDFSYRVSKTYKLAFATNALAIHNHSIIGRYDVIQSYGCKVAGYGYFYKKNIKKNLWNSLTFYWVEIGVLFDALQYCVKNKNLQAIKGIIKGIKMIRSNYSEVPFIKKSALQPKK